MLSELKTSSLGRTVINYSKASASQKSNIRQNIFEIFWDRQGVYKKQIVVIMKGERDEGSVQTVDIVFLLFSPNCEGPREPQ